MNFFSDSRLGKTEVFAGLTRGFLWIVFIADNMDASADAHQDETVGSGSEMITGFAVSTAHAPGQKFFGSFFFKKELLSSSDLEAVSVLTLCKFVP
jgi:hypothetical protein